MFIFQSNIFSTTIMLIGIKSINMCSCFRVSESLMPLFDTAILFSADFLLEDFILHITFKAFIV